MPHKGLAYILVGKLLGKRLPKGAREAYSSYVKSPEIRDKAAHSKRTRGRKVVTTSKGAVYDLDEIFAELNEEYFAGSIAKPVLTWSANKTYRILGHHDATHEHIAISRSLDAATRAALRRRIRRLSRNAPHPPPDKTRKRPPLQPHRRLQTRRAEISVF